MQAMLDQIDRKWLTQSRIAHFANRRHSVISKTFIKPLIVTFFLLSSVGTSFAQVVKEVTPQDILDIPHRFWAQAITFSDVLVERTDGKSITIRDTVYARFHCEKLGDVYCSSDVIPIIDQLPLNVEYIFRGTVLSRKGKYYPIVNEAIRSITTNQKVSEQIQEVLGTPESLREHKYNLIFAEAIQSAQRKILSYAQAEGIEYEEVFNPRSLHHRRRSTLVNNAITDMLQQDEAPQAETMLAHLIDQALFAKLEPVSLEPTPTPQPTPRPVSPPASEPTPEPVPMPEPMQEPVQELLKEPIGEATPEPEIAPDETIEADAIPDGTNVPELVIDPDLLLEPEPTPEPESLLEPEPTPVPTDTSDVNTEILPSADSETDSVLDTLRELEAIIGPIDNEPAAPAPEASDTPQTEYDPAVDFEFKYTPVPQR